MGRKNILIRMPNWIGDFVMATPILSDLRKKFPSASITVMAKDPLVSLLEKDPEVDELFSFRRNKAVLREEKRCAIS